MLGLQQHPCSVHSSGVPCFVPVCCYCCYCQAHNSAHAKYTVLITSLLLHLPLPQASSRSSWQQRSTWSRHPWSTCW